MVMTRFCQPLVKYGTKIMCHTFEQQLLDKSTKSHYEKKINMFVEIQNWRRLEIIIGISVPTIEHKNVIVIHSVDSIVSLLKHMAYQISIAFSQYKLECSRVYHIV